MDQARDMIEIRHMVVSKEPKVIGPTTSINGLFLGPFWYYFNLPAFLVSKGNPAALVYWNIISYQLTGLLIWFYLKRKDQTLGLIASLLFLIMPTGFNVTRYAWNANPMPIFTAILVLLIFEIIKRPSTIKKILLGFLVGLTLQIEAAFAIIFLPYSFYYLSKQKRAIKNLQLFFVGFLPTLLPQVLFELKHRFVMTKTLIKEFTGQSDMLGSKLSLSNKITDLTLNFRGQLHNIMYLNRHLVLTLFVMAIISFVYLQKKKHLKKYLNTSSNQLFSLSLTLLIFALLTYLVFPHRLKHWYLFGLATPFIFILASLFTNLFHQKSKSVSLLLGILLLSNFALFTYRNAKVVRNEILIQSDDPSNFANRLRNIDVIYQNAAGEGFRVYSYLPSIYDLPQQYTFWWYGTKKYGYQPEEIAYLPNQPEYIKDNSLFWNKKRTSNSSLTYLIIEHDKTQSQKEEAWLGNFKHLCLKEKVYTSPKITVEQREKCSISIHKIPD
jgi:hypothetical protein